MKQQIGHGVSGTVSRVVSAAFPNVVLKKGPQIWLKREAKMLRFLHHPNIVHLYAEVDGQQVAQGNRPMTHLALQRLGPSLSTMSDDPHKM